MDRKGLCLVVQPTAGCGSVTGAQGCLHRGRGGQSGRRRSVTYRETD